MLSRKALVEHAIQFKNPEFVPLCVMGSRIGLSDVLTYDLSLSDPNDPNLSEWGFARKRTPEGQWIIPKEAVLDDWKQVDAYKAPPLDLKRRFSRIEEARKVCGDRYRLASFGLSGYSIYSALRGSRWSSEDYLRDTDRFNEFLDRIMEFETSLFDTLARRGFHGVEFCDGWGRQPESRITLSLWRRVMRNAYARQIKHAKDVGLQVWFSASDDSRGFIGDLKEIGADVVRVLKPKEIEVASLGRNARGRVAFATRVDELFVPGDYETSEAQIHNVRDCLGVLTGGFIATVAANVEQETIREIHGIVKSFKNA